MQYWKAGFPGSGGGSGAGGGITITELDGSPTCVPVTQIVFNGVDERVTCGANGIVYINGATPPPLLGGSFNVSGTTFYTGREPQSNINYEGNAGDEHTYLAHDGTLVLTEPSFGHASVGVVSLYLNGVVIAEIDLGANFVEGDRAAGQNIGNYNTGSGTFSLSGGICGFQGAYAGWGDMRITHVDPTSGIDVDRFQEGRIVININNEDLWRQGYNEMYIQQVGCADCPRTESVFKIFHDKDNYGTNDPSITVPTLAENIVVPKWLSGINYHGANSTFNLSVVGSYCFNNVYHSSNAPLVFNDGVSDWGIPNTLITYSNSAVSGVSTPPDIGEVMTVTDLQITVPANQDEVDALITVIPRDPYGSYSAQITAPNNYMIMSWGDVSTPVKEYFRDEQYRAPLNTSVDTVTPNATGAWDSTISLASGTSGYGTSLQVYDLNAANTNSLVHPDTDYTGMNPSGSPDYSGLSAGSAYKYLRKFWGIDGFDHSNGILSIPGITDADITSKDVQIWIKVPSKTVWLDANTFYNGGTFNTGADLGIGTNGEGCRINSGVHSPGIDGTIEFSLGIFASDASVNRAIWVMVEYKDNTIPRWINGTGSGFGLTNWG